MKILWIVNLMLPEIAEELKLTASNREGWLSGIFSMMSSSEEYELSVAYPVEEDPTTLAQNPVTVRGIKCYAFFEKLSHPESYDSLLEQSLKKIMDVVNPDILHIFGTEFPHALAAARAYAKPLRTLVGLQGLCERIATDYMALIPAKVQNSVTFRDFLRKDSLKQQQSKFFKRARNEQELLRLVGYVTGRTEFDRKYAVEVNPELKYLPLHESMRSEFYEDAGQLREPRPHSIFLMQGDYPIKGFHFLLEACGGLLPKYPDLSIFVAGNSVIRHSGLKDRIKTPAYGKYLRRLIKDNGLENAVHSLGPLDASKVKLQYLGNSIFVCPSYVDNSPNSIAEAMLLQVPIIASDAGGILSIISDEEGYIFKRGDVDGLRECIDEVFSLLDTQKEELKLKLQKARERALKDYDKNTNYRTLLDIYSKIAAD